MSNSDQLPNWSGGQQPQRQPVETAPRRGRGFLFGLLGLGALIAMGALGYFIAQNQADNETTATADPAAPTAEEESTDSDASDTDDAETDEMAESDEDDAITVTGDEADDATAGDDADATDDADADADSEEADDDADTDSASGADDSGRTAVFRGGKLFLGGKVPSQEVADFIVDRANAVVGPDNVVAEYEIDPSVVIDPGESTPLYVEDVVLFQFNSVEIDPPFFPLLDLGTLLLRQNPQASLTVVTRTDAVGSEEVNLDVARKRGNAVINYWLAKGVSADQLSIDARGEEGASESDDEQAAALQRRAEFVITGLLD